MGTMEGNVLLNRKDLSEYIGVSDRTLRRWEQKGYLPRIKIGNSVRYKISDVKKLLNDLRSQRAL